MTSFDYRLNPLYPIKECSSCGALYTTDYCCSEGSLGDKIICDLDKTPALSQRFPQNCPKCGNSVDGHYCQGCALLRKKFKEDLFTYCIENGILQDSSKPSNDNTNVDNALQESFVVKQDPDKNSSQSPPQINHYCCYECVPIVPYPEPFNNQTVDELPQTLPSFDPTFYSEDGNSFTYDPTYNLMHDSPNDFNPPLQPPTYSYEFCGNDAYYGHDCSLQVPFTYDPEPCYNQDFNFPQNFQIFQQYPCCTRCGGPYETCQCDQLIFDEPYYENYRGPHMNFQCQPMNQNHYKPNPCYDSNSFGFDQFQPPQFPVNHQPIYKKTYAELLAEEHEANINTQPFQYSIVPQPPQEEMSVEFLQEKRNQINSDVLELFQRLHNDVHNIREELAVYINTPNWDRPTICYDDDDEDYAIAVTPSLSTEEPDNSLSMGDEHRDIVLATKSNKFIKSSVENLVPIPSESEGIPDNMCDMPFHDNSPPLDVLKDQFEDFSDSNDESTSNDDDSFSIDNIEYVEASPPNSELVSSEVMEIVNPDVGGIEDDILLTIKDDILREKLFNVNLLIANIEALKDNPTPSSNFMTKSSSTSLNSLSEETNTFDNSLPEFEIFCIDLEEISSGSTTTRSDISLLEYEAFYDDHVKEISSGSTTTHYDSSLYDSFIFDLSINPFPLANRSDFYEFTDELTHIISPPEYDCFCFKIEPNSGDFTMDVVEDTFPTREPRVHNALPTHPTIQLNLDFILSSESFFAYVLWIFLPFLSYSVAPKYLLSFGNEDTIFDPGICSYHISSFMPDVSHRSGTFIKFQVLHESPMEILLSTCSPMDQ
uniref:Pre-mRNA splicing Prp18-interacting factor n=1 Tax=Tanacetum cinerariifolium TaxID=118510 RepID=A0A6L2LG96_TANCI|nr:hypothetical protein [Tanacetum cinerariifolium]